MKIKGRLEKVAKRIGAVTVALAFARSRVRHFTKVTDNAEAAAKQARHRADQLREEGKPKKARRQDRKAARKKGRERNARDSRRAWIGRTKALAQRKHELKRHKEELEAELAAWEREHEPRVKGNKVVGADAEERLAYALRLAAARCASGKRRNFYSQPGAFSARFLIEGEPYGYRSDCSQFGSTVTWACDLPDPNGQDYRGGYTGTLEAEGEPCSVEYAMNHPACGIIYGPRGRTFHVEWSVGNGTQQTVGHGDARINYGVFDLFGGGDFRCFKFNHG